MITPEQPISLFSTIAVKRAMDDEVCDAFTQETGIAITAVYETTNALLERITAGARPDVMIGVTRQLVSLGAGIIDPSSCSPLAKVRIGVAVAPDLPELDISTVDALVTALTGARSVAYSRAGASGVYFARLLETLGIANQVNARATIIDSGFTAAAVLDGRAEMAVQLMSEHRCVPGAKIVGPLPDEVQKVTEFSAALGKGGAERPEVQSLIRFLTGPLAREAYCRSGMETADIPVR